METLTPFRRGALPPRHGPRHLHKASDTPCPVLCLPGVGGVWADGADGVGAVNAESVVARFEAVVGDGIGAGGECCAVEAALVGQTGGL